MSLRSEGLGADARARRLERADWEWVSRWFTDDTLARELGPLDEQWLEHVLSDSTGVELVIEAVHPATGRPAPIALVGVVWGHLAGDTETPDADGSPSHGGADASHAITDLAIDPARRGFGLGRIALAATMSWPGHPPAQSWVAFVDPGNDPARQFFRALGWNDEGIDGSVEPAMHRFAIRPESGPSSPGVGE